MLDADKILDGLIERNVSLFTGVPCSYLNPLINATLQKTEICYTPASSEGEALAISAGAWLAGRIGVVMLQNSGLGNIINPLTSLSVVFKIPSLLFITWRGQPGGKDEPQHELMGQITPSLLELMDIPWCHLPNKSDDLSASLDRAFEHMRLRRTPYAFIVRKGDVASSIISDFRLFYREKRFEEKRSILDNESLYRHKNKNRLPSRIEALKVFIQSAASDAPVIATTGKCGRELFTLSDDCRNLYCVGSMGYASALAHGVALTSSRTIYVIDGDGALLMHMGNVATIGAAGAKNFIHIVLDNGVYDTTGGQPTVSDSVDFVRIASACGYRSINSCNNLDDFKKAILERNICGPRFVHLHISGGSLKNLGRPTISPSRVAERFRKFVANTPKPYIGIALA